MVDARFGVLALALGLGIAPSPRPPCAPGNPAAPATAEPAAAAAAAAVGSPLICFPIDIGDAASLPFASDGFTVKSALTTDEVATKLRVRLGSSDDVLVHMETLRRAAVWAMSVATEARGADDPRHVAAAKFRSLLTDDLLTTAAAAVDATPDPAAHARREALRWFDLGYFLAAGGQAGICDAGAARAFLEKAARLVPDEPALRFGVALGEFDRGDDGGASKWANHLARLFDDKSTPPNLRKNVLATFGAFLGANDWDKLGAEVRKHVGRA